MKRVLLAAVGLLALSQVPLVEILVWAAVALYFYLGYWGVYYALCACDWDLKMPEDKPMI